LTARKGKLLNEHIALVVDANASVRLNTGRLLIDQGCKKVLEARDAREAADILAINHGKLHFLVVSFDLPKINGLGLVKLLRTGKLHGQYNLPCLLQHPAADTALQDRAAALDIAGVYMAPISGMNLGRLAAATLARPLVTRPREAYVNASTDWQPAPVGGSVPEPEPAPVVVVEAEPAKPEEEMWIADALDGEYILARSLRHRDGRVVIKVGDRITGDIVADLMRERILTPSSRLYVFKQAPPKMRGVGGR
jgi:CheY-like chemotaxis protein